MRSKTPLRFVLSWTLAVLCIIAPGCGSKNGQVTVVVKNRSSLELRNVRIELNSTTRTLDTLKPKESVTIAFPVSPGDTHFVVSADGPVETGVKENAGYVDHSTRQSVITFTDSPDGKGIKVDAKQGVR